ncbi:unnamed protein product [Allacma fusca]|uniref:C2H2-type domain-containing protein n=1 Tax=Allacma fusca TaxID=39272 RepID=A0A8J2MAG7_9HEXA|nr:unnamed protein product [Allacma fusca]
MGSITETGVIAITEIPAGARSAPFELHKICAKFSREKLTTQLQVGIWQNGEICPLIATTSLIFWPKLISIAPDCHSQNVRVCRWQGNTVVLQSTRLIMTGQQLFLWFGEDLLINDLGIPPYLNPSNIRGGNSYICNKCGDEFEAPNFLKIHLASDCGTVPMDILWDRLATTTTQPTILSLNFLSAISTFPLNTVRASCFIPPRVLPENATGVATSTFNIGHISPSQHQNNNIQPEPHRNDHAHLETIVSNMGKAKNGHVCLYCGKLYSRKYGLKIHIRTHTGYKPLKCKICHRPFGDPSNLNKHVRLHSDGNTPYRCEYCGKILVRRRDLDRHIRSRHENQHRVMAATSARNATITSSALNSSL